MQLRKRENHVKPAKKEVWDKVADLHPQKSRKKSKTEQKHIKELEKWKKNEESVWEIEDIIDQRTTPEGVQQVLIKWENWPSKFNTWEPVENLNGDLETVLKNLEKEKEERRKSRRKKKTKKTCAGSESPEWGEVEEIRDEKIEDGIRYYLVKWKDCSEKENSWEPEAHLVGIDIQALQKVRIALKTSNEVAQNSSVMPQEPATAAEETKIDDSKQKNVEELSQYLPQDLIQQTDIKNDTIMPEEREINPEEAKANPEGVLVAPQDQLRLNQLYLEQKVQYMSGSMPSEELYNGQFDISKYFLPGSMFLHSMGPEDKTLYHHTIENHRYDKEGNVEAFMVSATNKFDPSIMPAVFWCDIKEARLKYADEVMEYLALMSAKLDNPERYTDFSSGRYYD